MAIGLAGLGGGGEWSVDNAPDWWQPGGWRGLGIAMIAGGGGAVGLLLTFCRPGRNGGRS
jgi:hypothetical protein